MISNIVQNLRNLLKFTALIAILVVANMAVANLDVQWDMTEANIYSLSERSLETARNVDESVTLTFFHTPPQSAGGQQFDAERVRTLLRQYANANPKITFEELDHTRNPGLAREHGIRQNNVILIQSGDRTNKLSRYDLMEFGGRRRRTQKFRGESAITTALLKMTRATDRNVYFLEGFGEYDSGSARERSVSQWVSALEEEGYTVETLNPMTANMPDTHEMIVSLDPNRNYSSGVLDRLTTWHNQGGNLFFAMSPESAATVNPIISDYGMEFQSRQIIDESRRVQSLQSLVNPFVFAPKLKSHPSLSSLQEQGFAIQMGRSTHLSMRGDTAEVLLETSSSAISKPLSGERVSASFKPGTDERGTFTVGAVYNPEGGGKIFAFGSASIFGNTYFGQTPGNETFAVNLINWTFDRDVSLGIQATPSDYNQVTVTAGQSYAIQVIALVAVPFIVLLWGGWVWWNRKNR